MIGYVYIIYIYMIGYALYINICNNMENQFA